MSVCILWYLLLLGQHCLMLLTSKLLASIQASVTQQVTFIQLVYWPTDLTCCVLDQSHRDESA
jgi:hypothetical protein